MLVSPDSTAWTVQLFGTLQVDLRESLASSPLWSEFDKGGIVKRVDQPLDEKPTINHLAAIVMCTCVVFNHLVQGICRHNVTKF